jgi:CubicO group peptidase (beta-lactamase class C family)
MKQIFNLGLAVALIFAATSCGKFDLDDFAAYYDDNAGPGGYIAIFQNGETKYSKSFGYANVSNKSKFTTQTEFPISSMSKHITAACVLKLVEQNQITLDQDILDFFPELSSFAQGITVADLLNHTSGIPSRSSAATMRGQQIFKYEKAPIDWLVSHGQLEIEPGTKYRYGNTSYYLAGKIVEIVSEKTLQDFAKDEFFSRLGMSNTYFRSYPDKIGDNVAMGYAMNSNKDYKERPSKVQYIGPVGVFTTIDDFKKWDEAFHKKELFSPKLHDLFKLSYQLDSGELIDYAYGIRLDNSKGVKKEFHGGQDYDIGYRSYFVRYPEYDLTYVIFSNASDFAMSQARGLVEEYISENQLINKGKESLAALQSDREDRFKEAEKQKKIDKSPSESQRFVGVYHNVNLDVNYNLNINEATGKIEVVVNEIDPVELLWLDDNKAIAADYYHIEGIWLSAKPPIFEFIEKDGKIDGFMLDCGGTSGIVFNRIQE